MSAPPAAANTPFSFESSHPGELQLRLIGDWTRLQRVPELNSADFQRLKNASHLSFCSEALDSWNSQLLIFLNTLVSEAEARGVTVNHQGLPSGVQTLLALAASAPDQKSIPATARHARPLQHFGGFVLGLARDMRDGLHFVGESAIALSRVMLRRSKFNFEDLWPLMQDCGPRALPIVTLVSFLVGMILAYMGAVQLQQFGAQIFIADLVALGMAREMAAIMTGVVVAGRSGAAFAAQLGTMKVNEEIDALATMGISPVEYLVLPRLIALIAMVPLLTLYADLMGIAGGMVVAVSLMDIHILQYLNQTLEAVSLADFAAGLIKAATYGTLVAIAGCMRGMQCGQSAEAVGLATTSAVVTSIIYMVVAAALLAIVFHAIGL